MTADVLSCRRCGRPLTLPVERLGALPTRHEVPQTGAYLPTMGRGTWAVDPASPWTRDDGTPTSTVGCLVAHPDDGLPLEVHPDGRRSGGCCGHDGHGGPNRRCPGCHADVATLTDDCYTYVELRFEPDAVEPVPAEGSAEEPYALVWGPPTLDEYVGLRSRSGLSPVTEEQGAGALAHSWAFCHVRDAATGEAVAMGRVLGDGGWYFHVTDMATLPEHQGRGLGRRVLTRLLARIEEAAPPGAYVTLNADAPGRRLYESLGFVETAPRTVAMALPRPRS